MDRAISGLCDRIRSPAMVWRMKTYQHNETLSPMLPVVECGDNPLSECRSLVQILAKKTETLYRECRHDRARSLHIRTMGSTLAALSELINRLDQDSRTMHTPEILVDSRGLTYESVRSCDLNRICDK
jgi:hypothetical protein